MGRRWWIMRSHRSFQNWELPAGVKTLLVDKYPMAFLEGGKGAPLVLVHGSANDYRAWIFQMEAFGARYRTIAVSLRHFYPEHWNGEGSDFSLRRHAQDLAVFIQKLDAGPVHMVGHSRGADVALIMAMNHSELLRAVVLADPAPLAGLLPKTAEADAELAKRSAIICQSLERLQQGDVDGGLEIFIDGMSAPGNWQRLPETARQIRRDNVWSLKSLVADMHESFNCSDAGKIDVPVLLMTGEKSPRLYAMMCAALQTCLKSQQAATIPNASHGMNRENPDRFNAVVLAFLAGCKPPGIQAE